MDIKQMSVEQLKALAYDQIIVLENTKTNLNLISNEIASRKADETVKVEEEK